MLTIRDEQLFIFKSAAVRKFHTDMMDHIRAELPEVVSPLTEERFGSMVEFAIRKAEGFGLQHEDNIRKYVTLMFAVAPNFDEYLWFRILMAETALPPDRRFEVMLLESDLEDWEEAAELNNGKWGGA